MEGLTFRKARPEDTDRIAEIVFEEPTPVAASLAGGAELARAFGAAIVRLPDSPQGWQRSVLAVLGNEAVGVLQAGGTPPSYGVTPRMALAVLRVFGLIGALRVAWRERAPARLRMKHPDGAYEVAELHVHPQFRNRGIGGALLDFAEEEARREGYPRMSLTTTTANLARRLYERHGFRVVDTRTDPAYERYTGIAGRHLMVKELT